jgi:hypothetical protein
MNFSGFDVNDRLANSDDTVLHQTFYFLHFQPDQFRKHSGKGQKIVTLKYECFYTY